jgi:hypothetical protein
MFAISAAKSAAAMGGGGGGGGGGAPATSAPGGGPSSGGGDGGRRGGDNITIVWGNAGTIYAADRAQLGRDIESLVGEGRARLGRGA